jgi:iron complex outermembrane receptor protein
MRKQNLGALVAALSLVPAGHCFAQANATAPANAHQSEEIVVTAEKRKEPAQKAPAAIVALRGSELQVRGLQTLVDIAVALPTAQFDSLGYSTHLFMRGVGSGQDRITVDPIIGVTMDGVPLPREMEGNAEYDVSDVELLPGPQGTLYGGGAVAGVINISNNRPTDHNETLASIDIGNYGLVHTTLVENLALSQNTYVRGALDYTSHSAYETGDAWTADNLNGRISVLSKPTDEFTANLWLQGTRDNSLPPGATAFSANGTFVDPGNPWDVTACLQPSCNGIAPKSAFYVGSPHGRVDSFIAAGSFDWQFNGFTVTDTPSFLYSHTNILEYLGEFDAIDLVEHHQLANELRATSTADSALKWLVGLYAYQDVASQVYILAGPTYNVPHMNRQTVAPYGQVTYSVLPWMRLTGGLRYTWDQKRATFVFPGPFPPITADWGNVDWKCGVEADITPKSLAYATVQTGSEPGTLDGSNPVGGEPNATSETNLLSFTAGSKNRFFGDRIELNDEAYYYDYRHFLIQTLISATCGGQACFTEAFFNPNKMVIYGDQLDMRLRPTDNDRFTLGVAYNHARTVDFISPLGANFDDQAPINAPEWTMTFGDQHNFDLGDKGSLVLRANSRFESGYYTDFETSPGMCIHCPGMRQKAFTDTSLSLTYYPPNAKWSVGLWVKNLENEAQLGSSQYFGTTPQYQGSGFISPPRTFGLRATYRLD